MNAELFTAVKKFTISGCFFFCCWHDVVKKLLLFGMLGDTIVTCHVTIMSHDMQSVA